MGKYMKCSDLWDLKKQIRSHMMDELGKAIRAHGGSYEWYNEENENWGNSCPCVLCHNRHAGPVDIDIREVWIDKYGGLNISAQTSEFGDDIITGFDEIDPFDIQNIIELIPATDEVSDVTMVMCFNK